METEESQATIPFQLQFDKPLASQVKFAEWNPEKDLLAMVTEDSKILLHRFNWQRLWTISPGKCITALCWRPDGKAIAVGLEDGTISLHDVENGKLLRSVKSHSVAVVCLNWEEDGQLNLDDGGNISTYEDRTPRFFPPAPRVPRMPGVVSGDAGFMDDNEDSFRELSNSSHQRFNILCSGDKDGSICFSIFGIFHIGKINIHNFSILTPHLVQATCRLQNASVYKVALSRNLCHLIVLSIGDLVQDKVELKDPQMSTHGLHCLLLNTSIFRKRKNELHQVALQASNITDLIEVFRASLSVMSKQWSDAMHTFHEKFDPLSSLIIDHGLDSCPQEEFLSLLGGARTSPPVHQFLVNSLGEVGLKRVAKAIHNAGKELHLVVQEHLQPAAEIIAFRIGELRGLSRWRARYQGVGLDENMIDSATEKAGMLLVQVERFMRVLATVLYQFQNFFTWLTKCVKLLMSELKLLMTEPSDQLPPFNSELVVIFLKFLYDQDPVRQLLDPSEVDHNIEIDVDTMQRLKELVQFGGFSDTKFLQRTLAKEFEQMEYCFKEAFQMPFTTISKKIHCEDLLPLCPLPSSSTSVSLNIPTSISYYKDVLPEASTCASYQRRLVDYICFRIPDDSFLDMPNCVAITRGFMYGSSGTEKGYNSLEAALLHVPDGYHCVDVSLYKENQIILLLNETTAISESPENARMMMFQASGLPFVSVSVSSNANHWKLNELKECVVTLEMENEKVRCIPHSVTVPLAVSASRGVACVFAARKRALVYILDEDEDETSDVESLPFSGGVTTL
ncbi:anaphase-promoting complex subunit 4 isoform X2 [Telopea speciosissima]|uniref:anaphase-promoting complex subunit 4 isoform X2 n=1 Tax=Telopea speciosissima TaxID=54955 RepID=UPI001CC3F102|nr:anaphase-promoting complex subunit 4 isoform X2 [Telopea speciosissima]